MKITGPGRSVKTSSPANFEFRCIEYSHQQKRRKLAFIQISFIYNRNNTGTKIEPCGTPDKTGLEED